MEGHELDKVIDAMDLLYRVEVTSADSLRDLV